MVLPQAYQVDQTPLKMLDAYADDLRREKEFMAQLAKRDAEIKNTWFDDFQKRVVSIVDGAPSYIANVGGNGAVAAVKEFNKAKGFTPESKQFAQDQIMKLSVLKNAHENFLKTGSEAAKAYGDIAFDPSLVKTIVANSAVNIDPNTGAVLPKSAEDLGDPNEIIQKELERNTDIYFNRTKGGKSIFGVTKNVRPAIKKTDTEFDPTGKLVTSVENQTRMYPWTKAVPVKDPNTGEEYFKTVMDTEDIEIPDVSNPGQKVKVPVVSTKGYMAFKMADETAANAIKVGAIDLIKDLNKRALAGFVGPDGRPIDLSKIRSEEEFDNLIAMGLKAPDGTPINLVNPYDEGNREVFGRLYLTKHPAMQQYVENVEMSIARKKDAPPVVNVNVNTGPGMPGGYIDSYSQLSSYVGKSGVKDITGLNSGIQNALINIADDIGKRRSVGIKYSQKDLNLRPEANGVINLIDKSGNVIAPITQQELDLWMSKRVSGKAGEEAAAQGSPIPGFKWLP